MGKGKERWVKGKEGVRERGFSEKRGWKGKERVEGAKEVEEVKEKGGGVFMNIFYFLGRR